VLVHRLLERLPARPEATRADAARRYLAVRAADLAEAEREAIAAEVLAVLARPDFAALFGPEARAEVPIVGRLTDRRGETVEISGRIDRLVVGADEVLIVDFKSDRRAGEGDVAEVHVGQMALYRRLLASVFPGRRLRAFLLWTTVPELSEISVERLDRAEERLALS